MIYSGKIVSLREADPTDAKLIARYMTDQDFCYFLFGSPIDTPSQFEKDLAAVFGKKGGVFNSDLYYIVETNDRLPIGLVIFRNIDWKNRNLLFELAITNKDYRGKEYGMDTILTSFMFAFKELDMHKIIGRIHSFNERLLYLIEKASTVFKMTREGVLRSQVFRNGQYFDTIIFSMLDREYDVFRGTYEALEYYKGVSCA